MMKKINKFRNIVFFIAVIIVLLTAILGYFLYNMPHRNVQKAKVEYTISANALLKEFETNSSAATAKFVGKILLVSGKVESVKVSPSISTVQISSDGGFFGVNCSFNSNGSSELFGIKIGSEIQVKGECEGYIDDVILDNCALIK